VRVTEYESDESGESHERRDSGRPDLRGPADAGLLRDCRWEAFRGPGPGGQKRNKTSSAVRVTHVPSGVSAVAGESRSQHQNRVKALERLRRRLALDLRRPVDWEGFQVPEWFAALLAGGRLKVSPRHSDYVAAVGLVLDVLAAAGGSVSAAAEQLGVGSANLVDFLQRDEKLLAQANRIRAGSGLKPLGAA
jgi:hypothetical protein